MKPSKDNTFCYYPFYQIALKSWNPSTGIKNAAPCCNAIRPENGKDIIDVHSNKITAEDIFHGAEMSDIRSSLLKGERHPSCATCWKIEASGGNSYRLKSHTPWGHLDQDDPISFINNPKLKCIDFGMGDNCNLRCRMCMPGLSNKLRIDLKYLKEVKYNMAGIMGWEYEESYIPTEFYDQDSHVNTFAGPGNSPQWNNILENVNNLRRIRAAGGETTITVGFIQLIDIAIIKDAAKNIILEFHTNATKFTDELVEKLLKFKALHLNLSIDATGNTYEYIRYPMSWDKLESSVNTFLEKTKNTSCHVSLSINCVYSIYNAYCIPALSEYCLNLRKKYNISIKLHVDRLWPIDKYISVKWLSKHIKLELIELLSSSEADSSSIIGFLNENLNNNPSDNDRLNMLREIEAFDLSRKQNFREWLHPTIVNFLLTPIKNET